MIKISDYRTETAFPAEMKTVERMALAYAYDRQKKLFLERLKRVYIWADLDNVDENKLDFLAVSFTGCKKKADTEFYLLVYEIRNAPGNGRND